MDENFEKKVMPPPLPAEANAASEATVPAEAAPTGDVVDETLAGMQLSESVIQQVHHLVATLGQGAHDAHVVATLARGLTHDEDIRNADAAGYIRGRNEKIETTVPAPPDETHAQPVFPIYRRRSVWD